MLTMVPVLYDPLFCRLFRTNAIYINQDGTKYSMTKLVTYNVDKKTGEETKDEFFRYTEGIEHKFPGYTLDSENIVKNVSDKVIDIEEHMEFLTSRNESDLSKYEQTKANLFAHARFLSGKPAKAITYTSYPRSGNSFLRKYFENITGIATGSDQFMKFTLNTSLQYAGFKGEGIV